MTKVALVALLNALFRFAATKLAARPVVLAALEGLKLALEGPGLDLLISYLKEHGIDVTKDGETLRFPPTDQTGEMPMAMYAEAAQADPPAPSPLKKALAAQEACAVMASQLGKALTALSTVQSELNAVANSIAT